MKIDAYILDVGVSSAQEVRELQIERDRLLQLTAHTVSARVVHRRHQYIYASKSCIYICMRMHYINNC